MFFRTLAASLILASFSFACAAPTDDAQDPEAAVAEGLTATLSDAAIEGKLRGILEGASFTSESDFPYVVFEGDKVSESKLTDAIVRKALQKGVKANSSSKRDILPASCRADDLDVNQTIADGDKAKVPADHDDDDFTSSFHDRQLGIALKTMRSQLKSVVGFTFGTNAHGDEDEFGPVVFVYVGISKTSGKAIAIMTEAVFT